MQYTKPETVKQIVGSAHQAQSYWGDLPIEERARYILKARDYLVRSRDEVARTISLDTEKPSFEALVNEVLVTIDAMSYYSKKVKKFLGVQKTHLHSPILALTKKAYIVWEPVGVVGVITPWNYPFSLAMYPVVCALLAGNTVVFKPSELTPRVAEKIKEIFDAAGLPERVFQVISGEAEVGQALIESNINKIHFTGSVTVGRKVAELAAKKLLPYALELGGSDPMIVLEDANIKRAVNAACWGRFSNAGQTCIAVKRVYVAQAVAQEFKERLIEKVKKLHTRANGSHLEEFGPVINEKQSHLVKSQLEDSIRVGGKLLYGGHADVHGERFIPPTLVEAQATNMRLLKEETFGPVLPIVTFKTEDEAVSLANDSSFGLGASIFTKNQDRAMKLARRLEAGSVLINDVMTGFAATELPFGGVKSSGIGFSHGGEDGLRAFAQPKSILADRWGLNSELYWFPYTKNKYRLFSALIKLLYGKLEFLWDLVF